MKMKFLALVCAVTMVMGASLTAAAAGSSTAEDVVNSPVHTFEASNGQVLDNYTRLHCSVETTVAGGTIAPVDATTFQNAINEATALYGQNTRIVSVVDISVPGATFPYQLTIQNPNIWKGQNVTVLHQVNGTWEKLTPSAVGDNTVTVTVNSFSPFALVVDTGHSPKTMDIALMVGGLAGLFAAGTALTGKKKED